MGRSRYNRAVRPPYPAKHLTENRSLPLCLPDHAACPFAGGTQNVASCKKESKIPFHRCTEVRRSGFLSCLPQDLYRSAGSPLPEPPLSKAHGVLQLSPQSVP